MERQFSTFIPDVVAEVDRQLGPCRWCQRPAGDHSHIGHFCPGQPFPPTKTFEASTGYEVIDLDTDESHGTFASLSEARGAVRFDRLRAYSIWHNDLRVECCDPYDGDDDRIKQALGLPNASEEDDRA